MLRGFRQGPDAAGAQHFANHLAVLQDADALEVGAIGPLSGALGEAAVVTKGCGFSTSIALCHFEDPFL